MQAYFGRASAHFILDLVTGEDWGEELFAEGVGEGQGKEKYYICYF